MISTKRLALLPWRDEHRAPFAEMHADPSVMHDLGGPIGRAESDAKLQRYIASYSDHGISRWAVETVDGDFLGYAGVMPRHSSEHPLGAHFEIGWRFTRGAWGYGYATESAKAALDDAFRRAGLKEIVSYTSADNPRSQAVMARLGLQRAPSRDLTAEYESVGLWRGLVWVAVSTRSESLLRRDPSRTGQYRWPVFGGDAALRITNDGVFDGWRGSCSTSRRL